MPYGTIKIDTITFTDAGVDKSIAVSGLVQNPTFTGNVTATGTISGATVRATTVSGVTVSGTTANFASGVFTTQISGAIHVAPAGTAGAPSVQVGTGASIAPGLYSTATDQLGISTGGSFRLVVDSIGRVGIGTANPTELLELSAGTDPKIHFVDVGNTTAKIGIVGSTALGFEMAGSERLRIDSSGRVGIGTSSPASLFHLNGSASGGGAIFSSQNYNYATISQVISSADAVFGGGVIASDVGGEVKKITADVAHYVKMQIGEGITFHTNITGASGTSVSRTTNERMRIDSNGCVGVGMTPDNQAYRLQIYNSSQDVAAISLGNNVSGSGALNGLIIVQNQANTQILNRENGYLSIATNNTERARIDSTGRVGINTSSPNRKLEVFDASADNFIRVNATGAIKSGIEFANGGTAYGQLYFNNTPPYDLSLLQQYITGSLILGTNSTERARIDSSGRLLVGTSSNSGDALLQVNGDRIRVATAKTPASATDTGTAGEICWDANYIYVCTATNTWKRTAIATW